MAQPTRTNTTNVVVLNQHGDNRGDEAAMLAMVRGLGERLPDAHFTIVHQFADAESQVDLPYPGRYLPLRLHPLEYVRLFLHVVLRIIGLRAVWLLGRGGRAIVEAIDGADLVVSAPGGPYFGDIYADHEIVHWLFVGAARVAKKPLALYATSCGPFEHRLLNPVRRVGYRWFDRVILREERSAAMLRELTGIEAAVTIDAALQETVPADDRERWASADHQLLVVAVRDPQGTFRNRHDDAVVAAVHAVTSAAPTAVVFLPQLHGAGHQDAPYLQTLADRVEGAASVTVASDQTDSRAQRALVATADFVIAGRYHPAVFSVSAATPVLVIPYEHKAQGLAEAAGIEAWAIPVEDLTPERAVAAIADLVARADEVRALLRRVGPDLRALSARTSDLVAELV